MTTTVDQQGRAVLPFQPGDVLEIETQSADTVLLRRKKTPKPQKPKLVRIKGELFSEGGGRLTTEEVRRIIEEEP
jgi:bifunctional DNA-binding transcriptional regulator/antitoxin component of YhaV-PrlF toxin-antitoxin module